MCGITTASISTTGWNKTIAGVKGRHGPMRGFKCPRSAGEFCRTHDELRDFLRSRSRTNQQVSADYRGFHFLRRTATILSMLEAA